MTSMLRAVAVQFVAVLFPTLSVAQGTDTTIINVSLPVHPGIATLVEEITLGNGSSSDLYTFTWPRLFPGSNGSVYVIDSDNVGRGATVRQYDRNGHFVRNLGRSGPGPGEYTWRPGEIKELPDGRILMSDARGLLVYSQNGASIGRWFAKGAWGNRGSQILLDPAGFIGLYGADVGIYAGGVPVNRVPVLYRFRLDGTVVDTIAPPEASFKQPASMAGARVPFIPTYKSAWSPLGYFVTSYVASYAIDLRKTPSSASGLLSRPGDPVTSIRRRVSTVPVLAEERNDWRQSITMFMRSGGGLGNWQWTGPEIPAIKPPVSDIFVDIDGRIWVRLSQTGRVNRSVSIPTRPATRDESYRLDAQQRWTEAMVYDVLEPSGRYLGQVRFPDGTVSTTITGNTVWAVVNDSEEVPTIRRYRIGW